MKRPLNPPVAGNAGTATPNSQNDGLVEEFSQLLASKPSEEQVHQFIFGHRDAFLMPTYGGADSRRWVVSGTLSKFPITPERVPDLTFTTLTSPRSQLASSVSFVELKRPDARLFSGHGKMSPELNDAWMESVESQRLLGLGAPEFFRRLVSKLDSRCEGLVDALFKKPPEEFENISPWRYSHVLPRTRCFIFIGRRASLSDDELLTVRQLGASSSWSINVATYDGLLDILHDPEHGRLVW